MKRITKQAELTALADELGVRTDWHEPDEQDVTAEVRGRTLDNAGFWGMETDAHIKTFEELHVVIHKDGEPVAAVNLATLLGWAAYPAK